MGKEVIQGILIGLAGIAVTVTIGSFGGQLYSSLAHHGGKHGSSEKHSSGDKGASGESGDSKGEKSSETSEGTH